MAIYLPPATGVFLPPPPLPRPPWSPPPSPTPAPNNSMSAGGAIAGISIAVGILLFLGSCICSLIRDQRQSRGNADADAAAAEAAAVALPPRTEAPHQPGHSGQQVRGDAPEGEPRRATPTAGLPSFTYNPSLKHNGTGSGEEAATCSVCLSAFQVGETVRLLPVCLHLYHVECIDPWLDAHSSCPMCRKGTDPAMDGSLLPPV